MAQAWARQSTRAAPFPITVRPAPREPGPCFVRQAHTKVARTATIDPQASSVHAALPPTNHIAVKIDERQFVAKTSELIALINGVTVLPNGND
jgi:hypothetical protein